ncbi:RluA family pseudouridine synthase [Mycoplasma sp. Mirounga ES2805-ORL]|uniref:RluA family pseudouridine synthase n=1 Tax=Mycoplasma sp. Mirounga ES2805-ORL TaxID=754514 RepID=UPI00197C0513|nr:RluA family pseudouridine synthase [Mycoplasma sp. Mirounga ES2805-ORL]QSF13650.1 RluA family pseudouridine synthase [Mycoplasma sp. Mirounga ES2805-ORL]
MKIFKATKNDQGRTLYKFVKNIYKNNSLNQIYRSFRKGDIKVNGKSVKDHNYIINFDDEIKVYGLNDEFEVVDFSKKEQILKLDIVYEDKNILIVNKPFGIAVHDTEPNSSLDKEVLKYLKYKTADSFKPSHVGRLDKATSGLIVYGKNYKTVKELNYKTSFFTKIYEYISEKVTPDGQYWVDVKKDKEGFLEPIAIYNEDTKPLNTTNLWSTTFFTLNGHTYAQLGTGKKNQIRVTLSALKNPIIGDWKYGGRRASRLYLHAYKIIFNSLESDLKYLNNKEFICNKKIGALWKK